MVYKSDIKEDSILMVERTNGDINIGRFINFSVLAENLMLIKFTEHLPNNDEKDYILLSNILYILPPSDKSLLELNEFYKDIMDI